MFLLINRFVFMVYAYAMKDFRLSGNALAG